MKNLFLALVLSVVTLGLSIGEAQAARFGGGKSFGMQRQSVAPRPAKPPQQATPASPSAPAGAAAAPKRNWMGPIAGLAAGLGIAALLSHFGMGEGMANILMIALLAMAAVFVFKFLFRRSAAPSRNAMQYAGVGTPAPQAAAPFGSSSSQPAASTAGSVAVPEGFDSEAFLRVAKLNFVRLQASNDAKNLDDIREFVSPELYAEIKLQMDERGNAAQQTDIVTLNAELLEVVSEATRHVASVHFSGMISEEAGAAAVPFAEIWHLSKPTEGGRGWTVAGIQQPN